MKFILPIALFFSLALISLGAFIIFEKNGRAMENSALAVLSMNGSEIRVEIADTPSERLKGLSGKTQIAFGEGMLFAWEKNGKYGIWMKEMDFPIDVIWLDENFEVVHIIPFVPVESYPNVFYPDEPARYVLETQAGFAAKIGLLEGDRLKIDKASSLGI